MRRTTLVIAVVSTLLLVSGCWRGGDDDDEESRDVWEPDGEQQMCPAEDAGGETRKVDLLWVIDNSTSMCQKQEGLRTSFKQFISTLNEESPVDFQVGVTTTHFTNRGSLDPVARPGHLQSVPHPVVGFQESCRFQEDGSGNKDFTPLRRQIDRAVECTQKPSNFERLTKWTRDHFKCAVIDENEQGSDPHSFCEDLGKKDGEFTVADLFPCAQANGGDPCTKRSQFQKVYRELPTTLRAADYQRQDGTLKTEQLERDFSCMSFVGTRGDSFEQGLNAAAKAVSPLMTGGPAGNPYKNKSFEKHLSDTKQEVTDGATRPNHGFLRSDAKTAVIFLTDDNDCSHKGDAILNLSTGTDGNKCGSLNCDFATSDNFESDPLLDVQTLYDEFVANLKKSRRKKRLRSGDLMVASIHGAVQDFDKLVSQIPDTCSGQDQERLRQKLVTCTTAQGKAKSGGRYAAFMDLAKSNGFTVVPENTETGFLCSGDTLDQPLQAIAEAIGDFALSCPNGSGRP